MARTRRQPLMWNDPELAGHREVIADTFADLGNVLSNTPRTIGKHQQTLDDAAAGKKLKPKTVEDAADAIDLLTHMANTGVTSDVPMTLDAMRGHALGKFNAEVEQARAIADLTGNQVLPRGSAWYFNHHSELIPPGYTDTSNPDITPQKFGLMAAAASPKNTPERERAVATAISELLHPERSHTVTLTRRGVNAVNARLSSPANISHGVPTPVSGLSSEALAAIAAHAAEEEGAVKAGTLTNRGRSVRSTGPISEAGLASQLQVRSAIDVAKNEDIDPMSGYDPVSKPKTWAHGKMTGESVPGSPVHLDYLGIAHHHTYGDPNQGMMMFSQSSPEEELAHPLRQDVPVAADTWWRGIMSGQPMKEYREVPTPKGGIRRQPYSPAKRVASDKKDPVAPEHVTKEGMGLPDDPNISREGLFHAYINEGIRQAAASISPISFNQFGQGIQMPISLVHEVGWTGGRAEAGEDPAFNADVRQYLKDVKDEKRTREAQEARNSGVQESLPGFEGY